MLSTPKAKGGLFLASSLCDGLEDNNIRQVATLLLNKDADPNILIPTHGVTPFHLVIGNGSEEFAEEVTKLFLRHGGNPNVRSNDGMTPVHVAAAWGRTGILELLLANGGDPLRLDNDGRSPFHYAFDGRYFKVMTLLSNYCENIQDKDDKPKYNMVLDKLLINNGDVIAEYVASKAAAIDINVDDVTTVPTVLYNSKPNSSSSTSLVLDGVPNTRDLTETECKLSNDSESFSRIHSATSTEALNDLSQSNTKATSNYSFNDLDFDFASLGLADVMQREKCCVKQIINHLSTSLATDGSVNDTLHNYKKIKQEESSVATNESDTSFQWKKTASFHKRACCKGSKVFSPKFKNNCTPKKWWSKHNTHSTCKRKPKKILDNVPPCPLDNSIVSMSPNFNTPNHRKRRNIVRTPLTPSHLFNDSIISKSPNLATPVCACRKRDLTKSAHVDEHVPSKLSKRSHEYVEFHQFNQCKRYIAQSTPRRKKRSIYKLQYGRKKFEPCRKRESDVIPDESITSSSLRPVNLNKTIFSVDDVICHDTVDSYNKSLDSQKYSQVKQNYNDQSTMHLDEEKYRKDNMMRDNLNNLNKADLDVDLNRAEKENEFAKSFGNDKKYVKSESNRLNDQFLTIRRDLFKTDGPVPDTSINNAKSACSTIESSQRENVHCIDCDTKKLLNEDLNVNINKACKHEKNWRDDNFPENLSYKLGVRSDSPITRNLYTAIHGKQVYLSDLGRSSSLKTDRSTDVSKRMENLSGDPNLNVCKIEKSSSLLSYVSAQEYKYEDPEEGVILLERRVCVTPFSTFGDSQCDIKSEMTSSGASSASTRQTVPKEMLVIDDAILKRELEQLGAQSGPITSTTRHVYLKRLMRLRNVENNNVLSSVSRNFSAVSSSRSKPHLQLGAWLNHLDTYKSLEKEAFQAFASPDPTRRWREGTSKTSFTYLLLDPRVTQDLPNRCAGLTESETWSIFLNAIFYIGKGKRSRPFAHLYDAFNTWVGKSTGTNKKISRILDIWNSDHGVICLHVFQNVIPVEAYTREAVMIEAIGKEQLGNCKAGEYYGIAATWSIQQKQKFGRYLLYKALQILMHEGESQLFPCNL